MKKKIIPRCKKLKNSFEISLDELLLIRMVVDTGKHQQFQLDNEISAPIASLDLEDWLDLITGTNADQENFSNKTEKHLVSTATTADEKSSRRSTNLMDSIDLCSSLEDLVKTFDKNVKECLTNYKDIDIGQLAPVQVRLQEDLINDSQ